MNNIFIDWEASIRTIGKKEFAEQMIAQLIKRLPADLSAIQMAYAAENYALLKALIHKLHGALCYCVLPRINPIVEQLETSLKNNIMVDLPSLLNQLDSEVKLLLKHFSLQTQPA